jgi:SnoaL-like domain
MRSLAEKLSEWLEQRLLCHSDHSIAQTKKPLQEKTMDGTEIISVVNRIAILSDLRDWEGVRRCFTDQVAVDYTSLSGGQPEAIAADALIQS